MGDEASHVQVAMEMSAPDAGVAALTTDTSMLTGSRTNTPELTEVGCFCCSAVGCRPGRAALQPWEARQTALCPCPHPALASGRP